MNILTFFSRKDGQDKTKGVQAHQYYVRVAIHYYSFILLNIYMA